MEQLKIVLNINNILGIPEDNKDDSEKIKNSIKNENKERKENLKKEKIIKDFDEEEEEEEEEYEEDNKDFTEDILNENKRTLFNIKGNYVFTADNYFKMALILLRIRAGIPVIMMGETGCGKTSLIRKLSEMLNER